MGVASHRRRQDARDLSGRSGGRDRGGVDLVDHKSAGRQPCSNPETANSGSEAGAGPEPIRASPAASADADANTAATYAATTWSTADATAASTIGDPGVRRGPATL